MTVQTQENETMTIDEIMEETPMSFYGILAEAFPIGGILKEWYDGRREFYEKSGVYDLIKKGKELDLEYRKLMRKLEKYERGMTSVEGVGIYDKEDKGEEVYKGKVVEGKSSKNTGTGNSSKKRSTSGKRAPRSKKRSTSKGSETGNYSVSVGGDNYGNITYNFGDNNEFNVNAFAPYDKGFSKKAAKNVGA